MLIKLTRTIVLHTFFISAAITANADNPHLSPVFKSTEKLMDMEGNEFFGINRQIELLMYMTKFDDKKGIKRLLPKLSNFSENSKEIGTYTLFESQIAQAELFLGERNKAKSRAEKALNRAPEMWLAHGNDRPFASYVDLMGLYISLGGEKALPFAEKFLHNVAKGYRDDGFRYQLYLNLGLMWGKAGRNELARDNFQKAAEIALTLPSGKGRKNERVNYLLGIASFQGQAGLFDEMAKTISLIDTNDGDTINAAWETIKATIDFSSKQTAQ
jgi:tetratricopeptide (TPR) repeat protein